MTREIILVTLIDGDELSLNQTKAFTDVKKAEKYFIQVIKDNFDDECEDWTDDDFQQCLDDGYYEDTSHFCVYINEIVLEDEGVYDC